MSRFNKLHIVSKIMVFCAVAMVLSSFLEGAVIINLIVRDHGAPFNFDYRAITSLVANIVYGLGFLGTVAVIEALNRILSKLENTKE